MAGRLFCDGDDGTDGDDGIGGDGGTAEWLTRELQDLMESRSLLIEG
jgi:hypothetical protein